MPRPVAIILAIVLALGATEGLAHWWMCPAPAGLGQPVLCYRPRPGRDRRACQLVASSVSGEGKTEASGQGTDVRGEDIGPPGSQDPATITDRRDHPTDNGPATTDNPPAPASTDNQQLTTDNSATFTPLPEIYAQSAPMLRCSGGQVFHVKLGANVSLHLAFFEWDGTDTGSVLEAFRHMPEACLGSLGMTLVSKEPPVRYQVGTEMLTFDHTIFREPGQTAGTAARGPQVHAFRAVWVANMANANVREGLNGDTFDRLRTIRLKCALTRFRPTHACVVQGAVRGATNGDAAWQAFETAMLVDLKFENR
ncbi:MAG: hypothetical protein NTW21_39630 [Verrucomicrobia bacterium]|nr:hypothetical protein [Verrucomicrobiota bacterium]